jgi:hypothetical protein
VLGWLQSNAVENGDTDNLYSLTVNGINLLESVPVNITPISWFDSADNGIGNMQFTVYDPAPAWADRIGVLRIGAEVVFFDHLQGTRLFAGNITHLSYTKATVGRWVSVEVSSYDIWLDWCIVPRLRFRNNTGKRIRELTNDRGIIRKIFKVGRLPLLARGAVEQTATDVPVLDLSGLTVREALEEVADAAKKADGGLSLPRSFYVDYYRRLHYFEGAELGAAPFRVTDQSYAELVTHHANAKEYWPLTDADYAAGDAIGKLGVLDLTNAVASAETRNGVPNQPYAGWGSDDASTALSAPSGGGAALTCSGGWALETWRYIDTAVAASTRLLLTFAATEDGPEASVLTSGGISLSKRGGGGTTTWASAGVTTGLYHIVVGQKADGTNYCIVNGVDQGAGSGTAGACGDTWDSLTLDRSSSGDGFVGYHQHHAWYTGDGLTAAEALAHYRAGLGIRVEDFGYEDDGDEDTYWVYVRGRNAKGSGWVTDKASDYVVGDGGSGPSGPQAFVKSGKSDTVKKRNRFGEAAMRRNRRVNAASFTIRENTAGWRAGQRVKVDDTAYGFSNTEYKVAGISGTYDGSLYPMLVIELGTSKRRFLKAYWRNLRGKVGK